MLCDPGMKTVTDAFFDTNVVAYFTSEDATKADIAARLLRTGGVVSVQVLNEFASLAVRKRRWPISQVRQVLEAVRETCRVVPLTPETHDLGLTVAERYKLNIYDAFVVAAALTSGCTVLYSEDMHDGLTIDGLTIRNPFVAR